MNLTAEDKAKVKAVLEEAVDRLFADEVTQEPVPEEPQWKVGDWIVHPDAKEPFRADHYSVACCYICDKTGNAYQPSRCRLATDADWTREIAGVKVRAYESAKHIRLDFSNGKTDWIPFHDNAGQDVVAREFCRFAGIPIMPYELSKGEFKAPA